MVFSNFLCDGAIRRPDEEVAHCEQRVAPICFHLLKSPAFGNFVDEIHFCPFGVVCIITLSHTTDIINYLWHIFGKNFATVFVSHLTRGTLDA